MATPAQIGWAYFLEHRDHIRGAIRLYCHSTLDDFDAAAETRDIGRLRGFLAEAWNRSPDLGPTHDSLGIAAIRHLLEIDGLFNEQPPSINQCHICGHELANINDPCPACDGPVRERHAIAAAERARIVAMLRDPPAEFLNELSEIASIWNDRWLALLRAIADHIEATAPEGDQP